MSALDLFLAVCIVVAAGSLLYRSLRKELTCSGCCGCASGRDKPLVEIVDLGKKR